MLEKLRAFFYEKKVLILGFGLEGHSTLELLKKCRCSIGIADANLKITDDIKQYELFSGEDYLNCLDDFDIIMKSPGIALLDKVSAEVKNKITSQTDLLLRLCECEIIGITGTKGKSTTSSLVYHFLKACGKKTMLIGNIGVPPLERTEEFTDDMIIVCEMSCHQLEYVKASPDVSVLLNVYEDHLDHYVDFDAYRAAKENIFAYQTSENVLIFNNECANEKTNSAKCEKITASYDDSGDVYADEQGIHICGITIPSNKIKTNLAGSHNRYNIAVALTAALQYDCDLEKAVESLADFHGLAHRLEVVASIGGAEYINDSISTIPEAAIASVKAFDEVDTLILGGMDRGISYDILIDFINGGNVDNIIFLPDSGYRIEKSVTNRDIETFHAQNLEDAVRYAVSVTKKRCVFSPAAASYGFYKNFEERGEHFKKLVNSYKNV